jgi:hypothetical protein
LKERLETFEQSLIEREKQLLLDSEALEEQSSEMHRQSEELER